MKYFQYMVTRNYFLWLFISLVVLIPFLVIGAISSGLGGFILNSLKVFFEALEDIGYEINKIKPDLSSDSFIRKKKLFDIEKKPSADT